jgi:putative transposase
VINRALDRRFIFADDEAKKLFLERLAHGGKSHEVTVYHWVIMSNHFHLAVEARQVSALARFLAEATRQYSQLHHRRHGGSGPLWERRFKSILVQKSGYLGKLGRYIERNPVRAGMVEQAWDYPWSSARAYLTDQSDALVRPAESDFYQSMGETSEDRIGAYTQYLLTPQERADDETLFRSRAAVIGDDTFRANLSLQAGRLTARRVGRPRLARPTA